MYTPYSVDPHQSHGVLSYHRSIVHRTNREPGKQINIEIRVMQRKFVSSYSLKHAFLRHPPSLDSLMCCCIHTACSLIDYGKFPDVNLQLENILGDIS